MTLEIILNGLIERGYLEEFSVMPIEIPTKISDIIALMSISHPSDLVEMANTNQQTSR